MQGSYMLLARTYKQNVWPYGIYMMPFWYFPGWLGHTLLNVSHLLTGMVYLRNHMLWFVVGNYYLLFKHI